MLPKLLLLFFLFTSSHCWSQTILFSEDFEGEAIGDISGMSAEGINWTATCPNCLSGDIFEVNNSFGTMKGLRGNDTNGPAVMNASGIDATGMFILILEFDYESNGYLGSGNLECHNECGTCSGDPDDVLIGACNNCWDFLLWELSTGTFNDGSIVLGNNCSVTDNGHVISPPACSSPYDANGDLIPGNDPSNLNLNISMAMWASAENMVIDNIVLTGYTKAEAIANGLISSPGVGGTFNICPIGSIDLFDFLTNAPDNTGYWDGPSSTSGASLGTINTSSASMGDYLYIVSTGSGCEDTTIVTLVSGALPSSNVSGNLDICNGDSTLLTITGGDTYSWSNGDTGNQSYITSIGSGYGVAYNSCGSDTSFYNINSLGIIPSASILGSTVICNTVVGITLIAQGGDTYQWSDGTTSNSYSTVLEENIYLIALNNCGSDTLFISTTNQTVIADFTPSTNTGTASLEVVFSDSSINATTYNWDFGNNEFSSNQNPTITYLSEGVYTVVLIASNDFCSDSATTTIIVDDLVIEIPNVFTPNSDNHNDTFAIDGSLFKGLSGSIYNRWGQILYQWDFPISGWDGTYEGKEAPEGTYYYTITIILADDQPRDFSGSFLLFR